MGGSLRTVQQRGPMLRLDPIMLLSPLGTQPHHAGLAHIHQRSLHGALEAICLARDLGRMRRLVREQVEHTLASDINAQKSAKLKSKICWLGRAKLLRMSAQSERS